MLRWLLFFISFGLFVSSLMAVMEHWRYDEYLQDAAALMQRKVTPADISREVEQAIAEDQPETARMYLSIAQTFGFPIDAAAYEARIAALETPLQVARRETTRFIDGFLDGEADSVSGVAGAVTADFTVIGDVRDLKEQYDLYDQGQETNALVTTLAGVGVGLTAATVLSAGTAAPAKSGVSALKMASRSGKLTPKLQRLLLRQSKDVFDYQSFMRAARTEQSMDGLRRAAVRAYNPAATKALTETATSVNHIRQSTSLVDSVQLLRYVENTDDLRRLEKVSAKYGMQTKGILKLVGKGAIGTTRVIRRSAELLVSLAASLLSFVAMLWSLGGVLRR